MDAPSTPAYAGPAAALQAAEQRARLRSHAAAAPGAALASTAVGCLLIWALGSQIETPHLVVWMLALAATIGLRLRLAWHYRLSVDRPGPARPWLGWFRAAIGLHGLVWGAAAWLPAVADAEVQHMLVSLLTVLAFGAITLTLFDLRAALLFAAPALALLTLRLLLLDGALSRANQVAGVMALLLLGMLALAGRRVSRARRELSATQRAEAEITREAREAQGLLKRLFEHAGQGISVFDRQFRLQAWNPLALQLTGLDPQLARRGLALREALLTLARQGEFGALSSPAAQAAEADRRLAMLTLPTAGVSLQRRPDGQLIELRRSPLPGGGFLVFHADVSERESAQQALAAQQRKLALVLARTSQGFWTIDNQLRTTDANPAMCRMLGLDRAQLLGRSIYDFVDEANAAIFRSRVVRRDQGLAEGYEISLRRADGSLVHCFNNATPILDDRERKVGALGLFSDISAQKRADQLARQASEQLAQQSQVLTRTLENLAHGVLHVDPQGRCIAWNQRLLDLLALPPDLMARRPTLAQLARFQQAQGHLGPQFEQLDPVARSGVQRYLRGDSTNLTPRYQRPGHDGRMLQVVTHLAPDGGLVRTYTDITEREAADAALRAARDEAERANQAKSDFLSRMSHELRTPMNAILGFGQLLEADRQEPLSATQAQRVQALLRGGRHLLALIDDVLDIARIEAGRLQLALQPVSLALLVNDVLGLMQPLAQARGARLQQRLDPAGLPDLVWADPTRLRQVLLNLLSNAIKFNREGGRVTVHGHIDAGRVHLVVADQGPGILPEQLGRLFQPFERLGQDGAVDGTGIGLALSRSLVQLMHGEIGVRSQPGQGSEFWLQLPLAEAAPSAAPPLPAPAAVAAAAGRRTSVLYIEDNPVNLLLMEGMLAHRPVIDLRLAELPEPGLAMAEAQPPDLVLLDIQLPGIDGFEVLRRLRRMPGLAGVPVIAVSANVMPADHALAAQAGFDAYLGKPVHMPALLALVDRVLAGLPVQGAPAP